MSRIHSESIEIKARWIMSCQDLPQLTGPKSYVIDGKPVTLSKRKRQVLDALAIGPINAASTLRLSDAVFRLKSEGGVNIETFHPKGRPAFYRLTSNVQVQP